MVAVAVAAAVILHGLISSVSPAGPFDYNLTIHTGEYNCDYCNNPPDKTHIFTLLDRVDKYQCIQLCEIKKALQKVDAAFLRVKKLYKKYHGNRTVIQKHQSPVSTINPYISLSASLLSVTVCITTVIVCCCKARNSSDSSDSEAGFDNSRVNTVKRRNPPYKLHVYRSVPTENQHQHHDH